MNHEPRIGPGGRDDDLTRALRRLYAAPADEAYWNALADRIMARVGRDAENEGWWQPLAGLARIGVIAAGIAVAVASAALTYSRDAEARVAYETIIETPRTAALQLAIDRGTGHERDATLQYVLAP
jgi:hypothetical protein